MIAPTGDDPSQVAKTPTGYRGPLLNRELTADISHELAEAVTDPQGDGWSDDNQGEIADIPVTLNDLGLITDDQLYALLTGADGTRYAVQAVWSNQGRTLAAFAAMPAP